MPVKESTRVFLENMDHTLEELASFSVINKGKISKGLNFAMFSEERINVYLSFLSNAS